MCQAVVIRGTSPVAERRVGSSPDRPLFRVSRIPARLGEVSPQPATSLPEWILRGRHRWTWQCTGSAACETDRCSGRRHQETTGGTASCTDGARRQRVEVGRGHSCCAGATRVASQRLGHRSVGGVSHGEGSSDLCGHAQELLAARGRDAHEAAPATNDKSARRGTAYGIRVGTARGTAISSGSRTGGGHPPGSARARDSSRKLRRPRRHRALIAYAPGRNPSGARPSGSCRAVTSPYLTTLEAAAYLRYRSASAVRNLVCSGALRPAGRRGRIWLFRREDLDAIVLGHGTLRWGI
jgi:hypothetical protein